MIIVVYGIIAFLGAIIASLFLKKEEEDDKKEYPDYKGAGLPYYINGIMLGGMWPVVLIYYMIYGLFWSFKLLIDWLYTLVFETFQFKVSFGSTRVVDDNDD